MVLGFVDCNYVAPFRRLPSVDDDSVKDTSVKEVSVDDNNNDKDSKFSSSVNNTQKDIKIEKTEKKKKRGGHDDVDTLLASSATVVDFASKHWVKDQGIDPSKIVFLGPNPPVITPR